MNIDVYLVMVKYGRISEPIMYGDLTGGKMHTKIRMNTNSLLQWIGVFGPYRKKERKRTRERERQKKL